MKIAVTIDIHNFDAPEDIDRAGEWLSANDIPATFFVPSELFHVPKFKSAIMGIKSFGHEIGSHSHLHDPEEYFALSQNDVKKLNFLIKSQKIYEDLFSEKPISFRAPMWCHLSETALDMLEYLEYLADSSATPQRVGLLSSYPYKKAWGLSSRAPYYIRPNVLEIPTSCLLIPACSTTFATLRTFSQKFLDLLVLESKIYRNRIINLQFHPCDFHPNATINKWKTSLKFSDFVPSVNGGFKFRHIFLNADPQVVYRTTEGIIRNFESWDFRTISGFLTDYNKELASN